MQFSTVFMSEFAKLPVCILDISFGMMTASTLIYTTTKGGLNDKRKIYNSLI